MGETLVDLDSFKDSAVDLILMDNIGCTAAMKEQIGQAAQKPLIQDSTAQQTQNQKFGSEYDHFSKYWY